MPEHLKALLVILAVAVVVFRLAEKPLCESIVDPSDYRRRRNLWFAVTFIAFLSHSFWLYAFVAAGVLLYFAPRERNPLALYVLLLFAIPPYELEVPGFGLVNFLFNLNHIRLLNLVILLPLMWRVLHEPSRSGERALRVCDWLVAGFILYVFLQQAMVYNVTSMIRGVFYLFVDIWLPYFVFSRALRSLKEFRDMIAALVVGVAVLAPLGAFEAARSWLLYDGLRSALGLPLPELGLYIFRGEGGLLRANVTSGNSIVFGYVCMTALGLIIAIVASIRPRAMATLAVLTLCLGLVAALSRGPWVGAAIMVIIGLALGPGAGRRLSWLLGGGGLAVLALLASPLGDNIIDYLPFVGTVDEGSVTYRQQLFEISMLVFWQNPVWGAFDYIGNPMMEEMRQGQGIIDIVNSYLATALAHGLVGLLLFVGPFVLALAACWRAHRRVGVGDPHAEALGRSLMATLVGILVTIATVSSISVVPAVYWLMLGLCVAYVRWHAESQVVAAQGLRAAPASRGAVPGGRRGISF